MFNEVEVLAAKVLEALGKGFKPKIQLFPK
jgi:hypothetical protein